jgi:hypothetical protein
MEDGIIHKTCTGPCGMRLPATREYFTTSRNRGGLSARCKTCLAEHARDYSRLKRAGLTPDTPSAKTTKQCTRCHQLYPATQEYFYLDHPGQRPHEHLRAQCKWCCNRIKEEPEKCGACGKNNGNLRGDIELSTGYRYGLLCSQCERIVSAAKADSERTDQVARYLKRTRRGAPPAKAARETREKEYPMSSIP